MMIFSTLESDRDPGPSNERRLYFSIILEWISREERGSGKGKENIVMSITRIFCSPFCSNTVPKHQTPTATFQNSTIKGFLLSSLAPLTIAMTLSSPIATLAIPSPSSQSSPFPSTTPYSQSQNLQLGLENG